MDLIEIIFIPLKIKFLKIIFISVLLDCGRNRRVISKSESVFIK